MRGQRLEARKRRLRALAAADQANRCQSCKRALPARDTVQTWTQGLRFCSLDCYADWQDQPHGRGRG